MGQLGLQGWWGWCHGGQFLHLIHVTSAGKGISNRASPYSRLDWLEHGVDGTLFFHPVSQHSWFGLPCSMAVLRQSDVLCGGSLLQSGMLRGQDGSHRAFTTSGSFHHILLVSESQPRFEGKEYMGTSSLGDISGNEPPQD